jgi:HSP20 family protein
MRHAGVVPVVCGEGAGGLSVWVRVLMRGGVIFFQIFPEPFWSLVRREGCKATPDTLKKLEEKHMTTLVPTVSRYPSTDIWNPFERLSALRQEMERLWDLNVGVRGAPGTAAWSPALDLFDMEERLVAKVELPGLSKEEIDISYQEGVLTVGGERKSEFPEGKQPETYRSERCTGKFQRSISLPFPIQAEKIHATYKNGVLTIDLPKSEEAKPRKVEVSVV